SVSRAVLAGLAALFMVLPRPARADTTDRVSKTFRVAAGTPIRVDATIAELTITGSDRLDLVVDIARRAPSAADLARFPGLVEKSAEGIRISAVQTGDGRDPNLKAEIA